MDSHSNIRGLTDTDGSFISADSYQGSVIQPITTNKYLYANQDPGFRVQPKEWKDYLITFPYYLKDYSDNIEIIPGNATEVNWPPIEVSEDESGSSYGNYNFKDGVDVDLRGKGTYQDALSDAFNKTGVPKEDFEVTKWGKDISGKSFPVEWRAVNGAEVSIELGHSLSSEAPTVPHAGW